MTNWQQKIDEAATLAERYNWSKEAHLIRTTESVPEGFGREVGKAIALFASPPPLGGLLQSREEYEEERRVDAIHAKRLARLRELIAHINRANRNETTTS